MSDIECNFCLKRHNEVRILLCGKAGKENVFICGQCIDQLHNIKFGNADFDMLNESEIFARYRQRRAKQEATHIELLRVMEKLYAVVDREQIYQAPDGPCLVCGKADYTKTDDAYMDHDEGCAFATARRILADERKGK